MKDINKDIKKLILDRVSNIDKTTPLIKNRKPIILLDQDEVLADYITEILSRYNETYNTNFTNEDIVHWKIAEILGEEVNDIMFEPEIFSKLNPVAGAIEGVKGLIESNLFNVYIVSAAHPKVCLNKYQWVKEHMPFFSTDNIMFTSHKELVQGDVLVDDGLHNIEKFKNGEPIIFDQAHNRNISSYHRVYDWLDLTKYLLDKFYPYTTN